MASDLETLKLYSSGPKQSGFTPKIASGFKSDILVNSPRIPSPGVVASSQIAKPRWWLRPDVWNCLRQVVQADDCVAKLGRS